MHLKRTLVFHSPEGAQPPEVVLAVAQERGLEVMVHRDGDGLIPFVNQRLPVCIILDGSDGPKSLELCRTLKSDPFTAIIPVAVPVHQDLQPALLRHREDDFGGLRSLR